jgi:hypothetical protein
MPHHLLGDVNRKILFPVIHHKSCSLKNVKRKFNDAIDLTHPTNVGKIVHARARVCMGTLFALASASP